MGCNLLELLAYSGKRGSMFGKFIKPIGKLTKTLDKLADVTKALQVVQNMDVLVGIRQEQSSRSKGGVTNAELGYILSTGVQSSSTRQDINTRIQAGSTYSDAVAAYIAANGDPILNIPPRPFLEPSIDAEKEKIAVQQTKVLTAALNGKVSQARTEATKLGLLGQNIVKSWFTDPRNNWTPNAPSTIKRKGSDKPLIDTGALRNSISYAVKEK